ncbi:MAG: folylpolyglutamate synthase/dihydrofolate synthase family protein [Pseudomonadota bacterium]
MASDQAGGGTEQPIGAESDAILERLLSLHPKRIDLTLDRLQRLLAALDHPENRLPSAVHVAGTNGKGSVCAMLRAGLEASGARVHVYTSPHLTRFHERIRLAGRLIDESALAALLDRAERVNGGAPITFFEITTAAAFLAFAEAEADWAVLEVGLGGRLDATNVVERPELCVITPVAMDHQEFLGDTLEEIAGEKAGILKPGGVCVVAEQEPAAAAAIDVAAERVGATLLRAGREWRAFEERGRLIVEDLRDNAQGLMDLPPPKLLGRHQMANAGVAAMALRALGVGEAQIAAGLQRVEWPARLQRLRSGPLTTVAPGMELWLDGGHNPAAGAAVAQHLGEMGEDAPAPLFLICGMMRSKDAAGFLGAFQGLARRVYAVPIPGEAGGASADEIAAAAVSVGLMAQSAGSVEAALRSMAAEIKYDFADPHPRVLICGSLHLAGHVLRENG